MNERGRRTWLFGGVTVALELPPSVPWRVPRHYGRFETDTRRPRILLRGEVGPPPDPEDFQPLYDSRGSWRLLRRPIDGALRWQVSDGDRIVRTATLDDRVADGRLVVSPGPDGTVPAPLGFPLEELLVQHRLAVDGTGCEFHAAAAVHPDGEAVLLPGNSGEGKSTLAGILHRAGWTVLSDDRVIVRRTGSTGLIAWGTPWHGTARLGRPIGAPLRAVFLPARSRGRGHRVEDLAPGCAAAELLARRVGPPVPVQVEEAGTVCSHLVRRFHPRIFRFRPRPDAADALAEAMDNPGGPRIRD